MNVLLNGAGHEVAEGTTLTQLLEQQVGSTRGSAVVVDDEVVPRAEWSDSLVKDGQRIELLRAVQGG